MSVEDYRLRTTRHPEYLDVIDIVRDEDGKAWLRHKKHEYEIVPVSNETKKSAKRGCA